MVDHMYKMGRAAPMLRCISEEDSIFFMKEVCNTLNPAHDLSCK